MFAHGAARRKFEIDTAKRREALAGECRQVPGTGFPVAHGLAQDQPRLLFHGAVVFGGANAKACLHVVVEVIEGAMQVPELVV